MAITGLFLISFLFIHLVINLFTLAPSKDLFNDAAHFMATNPIIYVMQYVLALGFIIHIVIRNNTTNNDVTTSNNDHHKNTIHEYNTI